MTSKYRAGAMCVLLMAVVSVIGATTARAEDFDLAVSGVSISFAGGGQHAVSATGQLAANAALSDQEEWNRDVRSSDHVPEPGAALRVCQGRVQRLHVLWRWVRVLPQAGFAIGSVRVCGMRRRFNGWGRDVRAHVG